MKKVRSNKGFTLVELIIVIAILAIIMLIAIPNFSGIQHRMQVRADKSTAAQIGKAVRIWYTEYNSDPAFKKSVDGAITTATALTADTGLPTLPATATAFSEAETKPTAMPQNTTMVIIHQIPDLLSYVDTRLLPTSLVDGDGVASPNQKYWVGITGTGTGEKVAIGIGNATIDCEDLTQADVTYTGKADAVAYIEP